MGHPLHWQVAGNQQGLVENAVLAHGRDGVRLPCPAQSFPPLGISGNGISEGTLAHVREVHYPVTR